MGDSDSSGGGSNGPYPRNRFNLYDLRELLNELSETLTTSGDFTATAASFSLDQ